MTGAIPHRHQAVEPSFFRLLLLEAKSTVCPRHLVLLTLLVMTGVLLARWLPTWPETVYRFFNTVFHIEGWANVVIVNNYTALMFFLYWFGLFDVLRIYVQPLEMGYLDIWLSKPVSRASYMLAKIIPAFAVLLGIGVIAAAVHAVAMVAFGLTFDQAAYSGTIASILGLLMLLLGLTNVLLLFTRDSFAALVIGFAIFMISFLPSIVYMYRPDTYAGAPGLAEIIVFPANLMWHPDFAAAYGPWIGGIFIILAAASIGFAGQLLDRRDIG